MDIYALIFSFERFGTRISENRMSSEISRVIRTRPQWPFWFTSGLIFFIRERKIITKAALFPELEISTKRGNIIGRWLQGTARADVAII